jgi:hypothetical protein
MHCDCHQIQWLGFGPEQLSVPKDFQLPVSSFSKYGGHASINVRYDSQSVAPLYRQGDDAPGNSIAYVQCKSIERIQYHISSLVRLSTLLFDLNPSRHQNHQIVKQ